MRDTKSICGLLIAGCMAATTLVAAPTVAEARDGRKAAIFGGLAAGAILGGALAAGAGSRAYAAPAPVYVDDDEPVVVRRRCWRERQAVYDDWGDFAGYRPVRVCN